MSMLKSMQEIEKKAKIITTVAIAPKITTPLNINPFEALGAANMNAYHEFINLLKAKAYSQSTFKTYRNEFLIFLKNRSCSSFRLEFCKTNGFKIETNFTEIDATVETQLKQIQAALGLNL